MNHLDTTERKNVNVLGEEDLAKVVGGRGRPWWQSHGGGHKHHGHGMRKRNSGNGMGKRNFGGNGGGGVVVNIFVDQSTTIINNF